MGKDYYAILGVPKDADDESLKKVSTTLQPIDTPGRTTHVMNMA